MRVKKNTIHYLQICLLAAVIAGLFSCEKKIDVKIKEQAREYPVIFGVISNDTTENLVRIGTTESYSGKKNGQQPDVSLSMYTAYDSTTIVEAQFVKAGSNLYKLRGELIPYAYYTFVCTYNSVRYEYSASTGFPEDIDSIKCTRQANGNYNLRVTTFYGISALLAQVKIGTVNATSDTTWKTYNERFPTATPRLDFLNPLIPSYNEGKFFIDVLKNCPFAGNELIKVELFSIDHQTEAYLYNIKAADNAIYDPLALSPPSNGYAFTNKALGIIIPSVKIAKIIRLQ